MVVLGDQAAGADNTGVCAEKDSLLGCDRESCVGTVDIDSRLLFPLSIVGGVLSDYCSPSKVGSFEECRR